jgi:2',3'-cyclic-nucleotide 2'-phosphodiesterase (5'-nucleotidase family)
VADVMLTWLKADVVILNAGSLRTDDVIPAGDFRMNDLVKLLPMQDEVSVRVCMCVCV